ncbi:hypothetical protein HMPREF1051_1488 [Neisseria sicca VK64]|uniref:Uncharacterized protein n=1 Tax=Neisseria sicca VK64 TaxID=1095748 RepID=I2NU69_NEISI|nr:hypothetical protein HMPREF1051_1488 [Neisseria sicca VK64]
MQQKPTRSSENSFSDDLGYLKPVFCFGDKAPEYPLPNIEIWGNPNLKLL